MKLQTYIDSRDLIDHLAFKHYYIKREEKFGRYHRTMPHDESFDEIRAKMPKRNIFDIEADKSVPDVELFTFELFSIYTLIKNETWDHLDFDPEVSRELADKFNVLDYCKHHQVERSDLQAIEAASYKISNVLISSLKFDKYRSEILLQIELYLRANAIPEQKRLSHVQIALLFAYRGELITSGNCNDIAREYGYTKPTSGESIRQAFSKWRVPQNRKGNPDTVTSRPLKTKINNIEAIIPLLNETQRGRAISDVNILKKYLFDLFDEIL
jgi:hypothetical protein